MNEATNYFVYKHTNMVNGKVYIGITHDIKRRWHPSNYKRCKKFYAAIKKYGWDKFKHEVVKDGLTLEEAQKEEIRLVALCKSTDRAYGYNISIGGDKPMLGYKYSDDQKKKIGDRLRGKYKGRHFSPKSEFKKGHGFSPEALEKMSQAKKGKPTWNKGLKGYMSGEKNCMKRPEARERISGANNPAAKPVLCLDMNGNVIRRFETMTEAADFVGKGKNAIPNICSCCRRKIKSAYGYKWTYIVEATA